MKLVLTQMNIDSIFRGLVEFLEQMFIHLLYALMTISRNLQCLCTCVHACTYVGTYNCHQLSSVSLGSQPVLGNYSSNGI